VDGIDNVNILCYNVSQDREERRMKDTNFLDESRQFKDISDRIKWISQLKIGDRVLICFGSGRYLLDTVKYFCMNGSVGVGIQCYDRCGYQHKFGVSHGDTTKDCYITIPNDRMMEAVEKEKTIDNIEKRVRGGLRDLSLRDLERVEKILMKKTERKDEEYGI